jgi:hypothetical protein
LRPILVVFLVVAALAAPARGEIASRADERRPAYVVVLGDSLAEGLWGSLFRRYLRDRRVRVINASRASTGFNATPYEDEIERILRQHPIDLLLVQTGANDRQRVLALDGKSFAHFGTPDWFTLYSQRLTHFMAHAQRRRLPVLWVGLPVMRHGPYDSGMRIISRLHQDHAERHGAVFLDTVRLTADEEGGFVELVKVPGGGLRRFRHEDGVHFWEFGYDRIADHVMSVIRARFPGVLPP